MSRQVSAPKLEMREAQELVQALLRRLPGYVSGWTPTAEGPSWALIQIYTRYLQALAEQLNQAPDKNKLAFLDMLGINLLPAQAARAPVVFQMQPNARNGRVPAQTRVAAQPSGQSQPIIFETATAIGLAAAQLAEIRTVWPGRDEYADHTTAAIGGQPFTLFEPGQPIPHELYLSHNTHLALAGHSTIDLDVKLAKAGNQPLAIDWTYWDGEQWHPFNDSFDETNGLTENGLIRLVADKAETVKTTVNGYDGYWIRGRLNQPLPPDRARQLPQTESIQLRAVINRALPEDDTCANGILPDHAFADGQKLDVTKTFYPFGQQTQKGSAFYFSCEEAFGKPRAEVNVCVNRAKGLKEEADIKAKEYEINVQAAEDIVEEAKRFAEEILGILQGISTAEDALAGILGGTIPPLFDEALTGEPGETTLDQWYKDVYKRVNDAFDSIGDAAPYARIVMISYIAKMVTPITYYVDPLAAISAGQVILHLTKAAKALDHPNSTFAPALDAFEDALDAYEKRWNELVDENTPPLGKIDALATLGPLAIEISAQWGLIVTSLETWPEDTFLNDNKPPDLPDFFDQAQKRYNDLVERIGLARGELAKATELVKKLQEELAKLTPTEAAAVMGKFPPELTLPKLIWEYWNGSQWKALIQPLDSDEPAPINFTNSEDSGKVSFEVPDDMVGTEIGGEFGRWVRIRVVEGSFNLLRLVTWQDSKNNTNITPVIEARPPALDNFSLGYIYRSPNDDPDHCLTYNDFRYQDHPVEAGETGPPFEPFSVTADRTPTLYLGFDKPLPADLLSLYWDIAETANHTQGPEFVWEYWDNTAWFPLTVQDETKNLALPGMTAWLYSGATAAPRIPVARAGGRQIQLLDARQAAGFNPDDRLYLQENETGELVTIEAVRHNTVTLKTPLQQTYNRATVSRATLPRFGTPRTWLRARLRDEGEPLKSLINNLHLNAVWAAQVQTITDEVLGSSTGRANQVFFFRQAPVLEGQVIEVRELEGRRAQVELPILKEALLRQGLTDADVRTVADPATGEVREVWVRWQPQSHLRFSGPDDRHYVVERSQGRLHLGNGQNGRIPPAGANNILARTYRSGGGLAGNAATGAITQLHGVVSSAQGVTNPRPAEGGAQGEQIESVHSRGPQAVRHRYQAITLADYEALAREASPAVAVARALPSSSSGGSRPGRVRVVIIPQSREPQPQPSFELRRRVRDFLAARAPAVLAGRIEVAGPKYFLVDVEVEVALIDPAAGGTVYQAVQEVVETFLNPLTGGPDGTGWRFGRDVYQSDIAALLEEVTGVDYVRNIKLLLAGASQGEQLAVPPDCIVAAGSIQIRLLGSEG